ncbi:MAG: NADH-quinone oxidoreductase subunit NuoG, partial [Gammaproteobacteria bacterium]|nr:NADH-quinone oxidoreductase subunit NuoG [Gammaproteobacteria bacterium]
MAHIVVDGISYEVEEGQNLLEAALSHHLDLPYFCWHPAMGSVGACRQCAAIEYADEEDTRGRLVMACITSVRDGMRFSIDAPHAEDFRKTVIEWLMENHPHDCPVCEEGGECHLQDMTVMTGHVSRRYRGTKRTWENQDLGPFIGHEMNRCITCYRCVRFYRDYAGGTDLEAFGSRGRMYFGRAEDGVLESEFAGNLVEVCPTGVFTDRPFSKQYTRKWDLQSAPSVCPGCSVGCNIFPSERYGDLKRIHNRYHAEVNGYFLCDRGRFGSHFVNADTRLRHAGVRDAEDVFEAGGVEPALEAAAAALGGERVVGIGSPRASVEANFALRTLVGEDNFCNGLSTRDAELAALTLDIHAAGGARIPTLAEVEQADAVLVLGEDVSNTAARVALALRQAARGTSFEMAASAGIPEWQDAGIRGHGQHHRSPVFIASVLPTRIDDIARETLRATPTAIARSGFAIAHRIDSAFADAATEHDAFVQEAATALKNAERPLVVTGAGCADASVLEAAANIAWALKAQGRDPALLIASGEANTMGVAAMSASLSMDAALDAAASGEADTLAVLENDLYRRADAARVKAALEAARVIVLDALETPTAEAAEVALPATSYAESTGTFVNYEGRAQRF